MKLKPTILNDEIVPYYILRDNNREIFKKHSTLRCLDAAIIYYAWYGRNAWNWSWATKYDKYGFFTQLDECKSWIETKRVQGSVWQITQLPALRLSLANKVDLWFCSVNEKNWWNSYLFNRELFLSKLNLKRTKTVQIKDCIINHDKMLSFTSSRTDNYDKLNGNKSCKEWRARSYGSNYRLGWFLDSPERHNYKNLYKIINSFNGNSR